MPPPTLPDSFTLRPAIQADAIIIRQIISRVKINPMSLAWQRFTLAVDSTGRVIGCGQVKPHTDGSFELASIAVLPEWRNKGIARRIIEHLLEGYPGRLYLTCLSHNGPMYQKFGFHAIQPSEMPPYFRRLSWIVTLFNKLLHRPENMLVMRRN
jgi:N-acetylglutamate synthase-like GNAT family acetyltransferase